MAKNDRKGPGQDLKNIYLTGFMCAGKTSSGRVLSRRLKLPFVDTDLMVAKEHGAAASALIRKRGLAWFRRAEASLVRRLARGRGRVVALGGGVYPSSRWEKLLKRTGIVVFLRCPWPELEARLKAERAGRPLLYGPWEKSSARARALYARRLPFYLRADLTLSAAGLTPALTAEKIERGIARARRA